MSPPPHVPLDAWIAGRLRAAGLDPGDSPETFRAALTRWQAIRLAETLDHARAHSLRYRKTLSPSLAETLRSRTAAGFAGPALRGALAALPPTAPEELAGDPEAFLAVSPSEVEGVISVPSSGTSGKIKRVYATAEDLRDTVDFFAHGMRSLLDPGARVAMLMSGDRPGSVGDLFSRAMDQAGMDCRILSPAAAEEDILARLASFRPHCLVALPGQALSLARHPGAGALNPLSVLLSADAVSPVLAGAVAAGLGGPVFTHYGMTETGLAGAVECRERRGCHGREADLYLEILDAGGQALDPEAHHGITPWGEIAVTTLTRRAMPLLRYRSGDRGRLITLPCPCGSSLHRLEVQGRLGERAPLRGGPGISLWDMDNCLYGLPFVSGFAVTAHYADKDCTRLAGLLLELRPTQDAPADAPQRAEKALARLLPEGIPLRVLLSGDLPRTGKQAIRHLADPGGFRLPAPEA
ncbi:MAG: phenylacetate--CoA ligase family protein [Desulfovibrio sp.]|jgi:phenylacetate-coenzyme A ligase PaaK-like adenylate-forming protein|nr:phenylacetate--CoA ligase family protein [Desulfovibrio sp.]